MTRRLRGFGALIAEFRIAAGLTPEQLADRLGYKSKSAVYRLESELQEPKAAQIGKLSTAIHLSPERLLMAMGVPLAPPAPVPPIA